MRASLTFGLLTILLALSAQDCSHNKTRTLPPAKAIVMEYDDFGPPSLCYAYIGGEKYSSDVDDPTKHLDIKVVVYRDLPLDDIKSIYPVIPDKQDFRYLDYQSALKLLSEYDDPWWDETPITKATKTRALQTKQKILQALGT